MSRKSIDLDSVVETLLKLRSLGIALKDWAIRPSTVSKTEGRSGSLVVIQAVLRKSVSAFSALYSTITSADSPGGIGRSGASANVQRPHEVPPLVNTRGAAPLFVNRKACRDSEP